MTVIANVTLTSTPSADPIVVTVTMPLVALDQSLPTPHVIYIPKAAIADRQARYRLSSPDAAFQAILLEHLCRLNNLAVPTAPIKDWVAHHQSLRSAAPNALPDITLAMLGVNYP